MVANYPENDVAMDDESNLITTINIGCKVHIISKLKNITLYVANTSEDLVSKEGCDQSMHSFPSTNSTDL